MAKYITKEKQSRCGRNLFFGNQCELTAIFFRFLFIVCVYDGKKFDQITKRIRLIIISFLFIYLFI